MTKPTDIHVIGARLYFLPVQTRVPLKFGRETLTSVTCARARVRVMDRTGRTAEGWGETPLSVQWVWPSPVPHELRHQALRRFCVRLAQAWVGFEACGHPLELGHDFQSQRLPALLQDFSRDHRATRTTPSNQTAEADSAPLAEPMPWLAALVCCSAFDLAVHDAYGQLQRRSVYATYGPEFMNRDLADFLAPAEGAGIRFGGRYPHDFLLASRREELRAWHLVGGLDLLDADELTGQEPDDGHPVLLRDWIERDGLTCLKVKLRGNAADWDYQRLVRVGGLAAQHSVDWLSADFNCTVTEPAYVNAILDRLRDEQPRTYAMLLYVEQPFPYDLEQHQIDVRSVASRKPLFLDESAHDWRMVRLGRQLGWLGVALKTCKTQTGALLTACWAAAHGMALMVQDLTNPMLAQVAHVLLAAHVGTIMGVETNAMQFYPAASAPEAQVHPGLYRRRQGKVHLATITGPGFGYRLNEIPRSLPEPAAAFGEAGP